MAELRRCAARRRSGGGNGLGRAADYGYPLGTIGNECPGGSENPHVADRRGQTGTSLAGGAPGADRTACPARHDHDDRRCAERSEEHTYELQSLMRLSSADFCLKKTKNKAITTEP